jgi:hypothetical protein
MGETMTNGDHAQVPRAARLFTTPFEVGLRATFILAALAPSWCDIQRLVIYDYLLVHSGDVEGGPESIHPATPHRSGELLIKRDLMRDGLMLFVGRELLSLHIDEHGIAYSASDLTQLFLRYMVGAYAQKLREAAVWVVERFSDFDNSALEAFVSDRLDRWGGEFDSESLVRGVSV